MAAASFQSDPLPLKYSGPPTGAKITPGDLMTRLYVYADDSMMGRRVGTEYNEKATAWIESQVRQLGLVPAGDSGGYFQNLPVVARGLDSASTITVGDSVFQAGSDFVASSDGNSHQFHGAPAVYAGMYLDTMHVLSPDEVRGKVIVMRPFSPTPTFNPFAHQGEFVQSGGYQAFKAMRAAAVAAVVVGGEQLPPNTIRNAMNPTQITVLSGEDDPFSITVTSRVGRTILPGLSGTTPKGTIGASMSSDIRFVDLRKSARNVIAILPGSDPSLKGEYVAIGAHNDHIGFSRRPVDHDSIRAFDEILRPQGEDSPDGDPGAADLARVRALTDSLHHLHPARLDSIYNGADDDGSGTVSVLEIAEAFAKGDVKPKRSILFIWHTGEEAGLWGSEWFTDHPTVPRDSIVAELNMDMVGRGGANDVTGEDKDGKELHGGPGYVQLVGSRRLSTELGDLVERVNQQKQLGLNFDYSLDANGHPQSIYCRSDHYEYARYGIPIVFFTTGGHADYHEVTDEAQYIDYDRMAQVARLVFESAAAVANLNHRVVVDHAKPDPHAECVQ